MTHTARTAQRTTSFLDRSRHVRQTLLASAALLCMGSNFANAEDGHAHDSRAGDIAITQPWSRATLPGAKVAAGYLSLSNEGATPDRLVAVTADIAGKAEVHRMDVDGQGVMTMRPVESGVEIAPGATLALEPGGLHIMFMDLKAAPQQDTTFKGTLTFEKAGTVEIEYAVVPAGGRPDPHAAHATGG